MSWVAVIEMEPMHTDVLDWKMGVLPWLSWGLGPLQPQVRSQLYSWISLLDDHEKTVATYVLEWSLTGNVRFLSRTLHPDQIIWIFTAQPLTVNSWIWLHLDVVTGMLSLPGKGEEHGNREDNKQSIAALTESLSSLVQAWLAPGCSFCTGPAICLKTG